MTGTQLVYKALRHLGGLMAGQATGVDINADGLLVINDLIDSLQLEDLMLWGAMPSVFTLTPGRERYLIGPGSVAPDFVGQRPTGIDAADIILNSTNPPIRQPIAVTVDPARWASVRIRAVPPSAIGPVLGIPLLMFNDQASPQSSLNFFPAPQAAYGLELFSWLQMAQFTDLVTNYSFPPGYSEMLGWNLALKMSPMMRRHYLLRMPLSEWKSNLDTITEQAMLSRANIQSFNAPTSEIQCDEAVLGAGRGKGGFNYLLGESRRS